MRSIYFISKTDKLAKKKIESKYLKGLKEGKRIGKLKEVRLPKELGTRVLKFGVDDLEKSFAPKLRRLEVKEKLFVDFLNKEGAKNNTWMVRFWNIGEGTKESARTITVGKETLDIYRIIRDALAPEDKPYRWAGVTFSHPDLQIRVQLYRYPTASIYPERIEATNTGYRELKRRFEKFLQKIV